MVRCLVKVQHLASQALTRSRALNGTHLRPQSSEKSTRPIAKGNAFERNYSAWRVAKRYTRQEILLSTQSRKFRFLAK